ncbi:SGNH/GDSL hydrolase family protein [Nocardioides panacihumi]|uniref:SGNH/GDSL hydrolase family protein n=1 Tax=Nocardioides panacihumi TaxID=400774 RepID=A0ABN2RW02_9ACTN
MAPRLAAGLEEQGFRVEARVFAVRGARSAELAEQVGSALAWRATLAVVVIGANDLAHREPVESAVRALADAVRRLRASGAEVVVAPAPDLSAVPHVPVHLRDAVRAASRSFREQQVAAVRAEGARLADPDHRTSSAFAQDGSLFSEDSFHPSSAGYAVIADALLPAVAEAARESNSG